MKKLSPTIIASFFCCILFYTGILRPPSSKPFFSLVENCEIKSLLGKVISNPVKSSSGKTYSVSFQPSFVFSDFCKSSSIGEIVLYIPSEIVEAYYPGKLFSLAKNQKNQLEKNQIGFESLFGSETDFPLIEEGIILHVVANHLEREDGNSAFYVEKILNHGFDSKIKFYRAYSRLILKRILYNWKDAGGLLLALLSGSKEYTSESIQEDFKNAGLAHVLALSGMHLSIFASLPTKISGKKQDFVSLFLVLLFVWFAGISPSLFRALLCMILGLIFKKLRIKSNLIGILSISFLIQISIFPNHIYNYGFILSYGALVGLYLGQNFIPFFTKLLSKKLSSDLSASLGAQLVTAPICLLGFGTCSPIGIIASVIVSPIATLFLSFGIFTLILSIIFPFLLSPIGCIISLIYVILERIVNFFSKFPIIKI